MRDLEVKMNFEHLFDKKRKKTFCKATQNEYCYWVPTGNIRSMMGNNVNVTLKIEKHVAVRVLNSAEDVRFDLKNNPRIIVDQSMIEEISINNTIYKVIQDNYVIGIID